MIDSQGIIHVKHKMYDKQERAQEAQKIFNSLNIKYSVHNDGLHWIINYKGIDINYYPTTGKWFTNEPKYSCREDERFLVGILRYMKYEVKEIMN